MSSSTHWLAERARASARRAQAWAKGPLLASTLVAALTTALMQPALATAHGQLPGSRPQGEATLRFFGLKVYQARLWTLPDFRAERSADHPLVLELTYLRDFKASAIAERSLQEMRRASGFPEAQAQRWVAEMKRVFPDIKSGDRLAGLYQPGQGTRFWHNGQPAGEVADPDFGRFFFGIWLAPTTSEPQMRQALLGLKEKP